MPIGAGSRCPACTRARGQQRNAARGGSGWAWQRWRAAVIARDGGCVAPGGGGCAGPLRVDHILPLAAGGGTEMDNLRTLCLKHHRSVTRGGGG